MQTHNKGEMPEKALQRRNPSRNHNKRSPYFSSKIYTAFLVLSIVILTGMGWYAWNSFEQLDKFENQRDEMAELRGTILHLDEVLTMSAHMAASTGDLMWEERYLKYESQLDEAIQRLKIISRDTIKYEFADKTDTANIELVILEKQAFNLVHQGSLQAAANLLNSQKYEDLKFSYEQGMIHLSAALNSSAKETHDKLHSRIIIAVSFSVTVVLLLSFGWISLIRINKNITSYEERERLSSDPGSNKVFNRAAIICSSGAVFVAFLGLLGWVPSLGFFGNISPHFIPMAPTTSICFILLGLIVLIQIRYRLRGWGRFSAAAVTLLVSVFGLIELAEHFTGIDVENFFFPDAGMLGLMRKARMSPATGATFFLSGVATLFILLGEIKKKQVKVICSGPGIVGSLVVITGVTIIMGYLYGNPLLYGSETIPMAATTAIGFVFLGAGLVAAAPDRMPVRLLIGYSSRAKLLRVFLPLSILIVLSQDILHRFVFASFQINSVLLSVLSLMFFVVITGVIVTVMSGVIGRALDIAEERVTALSRFPGENPNPVLRVSRDGVVLYGNKASIPLLESWDCRKGQRLSGSWLEVVRQALTSVQPQECETRCGEGQLVLTFAPVAESDYVNVYALDITERKKVEEQLREAKQQAEAANVAKSQFLANMSHEIRTPMSVITGFADLLISEKDPDEQKNYVDLIQKAGKSLLRIIDEILDVSRIEAGKLEIKIEECSLDKLLDGIEIMMRPLAGEEGLQFGVFRLGKLPGTIQTDSGRLRQCLLNLIGNAIKFTRRGHVHLKVSADHMQGTPCLRFDVEDTGIGIPQDKHVAVFEMFSQVDGSHSRQYGGTGLGLTITKQLAQFLGGDLSFTSEEGKGSVFSLVIPAGVDAESSALSGEGVQTQEAATESVITDNLDFSGKVLLAEDAEGCQVLAQKILERYGLEVVIAANGKEAVEKTLQGSFDLILMDIQMPGLNGLEATKKLREEGITTPIVALTAYAMPKDRDNCMAAGCDDYISKPIDLDELRRVLKKYLAAETVSV